MKVVVGTGSRRVSLPAFTTMLAVSLVAARGAAHPTPGSVAYLDFTPHGVRIEQDVPLEELERALGLHLLRDGESAVSAVDRHSGALRAYAQRHLRLTSLGSGRAWRVEVSSVHGRAANDGPRAQFHFAATAPLGEASSPVSLVDDLVAHEVVSHYTTVYVRQDWAAGRLEGEPKLAGTVHAGQTRVLVARHGSFWRGLRSVVALGAEHITRGTDHWMFLLALVLVAPVKASGRRWVSRDNMGEALSWLARVASAFTLGHSATLALGAWGAGGWRTAWVEVGVALSILVSAAHCIRPIFSGREGVVAGGFGLVHGLAFASSLAERKLAGAQWGWTVVGFNFGVELAQLGLLALVVPWLLLLAKTALYPFLRIFGGAGAGIFALGWLLERSTPWANPVAPVLASLERYPLVPLLVLAAGTTLARVAYRAPPRGPKSLERAREGQAL